MREKIAIGSEKNASRFPVKALETLSGNRTLTKAEIDQYQFFAFDPAGARDLTLPAVGDAKGAVIFIANKADAAEIITIKNAAAATICTPTQNETAICWCDGTYWYGLVGAMS